MRLLFLIYGENQFLLNFCSRYGKIKTGKEGAFMAYILAILGGYLLGCSNMALYLSKAKGVDLRAGGSGNLGASNATALLGWKAGVLTALHDGAKAFIPALIARFLFPEIAHLAVVAGVAAVCGHMFPFYLGFKAGKGLASYVGMLVALNLKFALAVFVLLVLITVVTDFIVLGTTATMLTTPIFFGITQGWIPALILGALSAVIIYKHRMNYVHIADGTEGRLSKAIRGEYRVK